MQPVNVIHPCKPLVIPVVDVELVVYQMFQYCLGPHVLFEVIVHRVPQGSPFFLLLICKDTCLSLLIYNGDIEDMSTFLISL